MSEPMIEQALEAEVLFSQDKIAWWEYEKAEKARRDKIAIRNAGADEVNRLNVMLIKLGRFDDMKKASADRDYQLLLISELLSDSCE